MKTQKGISLIEVLVVITIFAVLGVIISRSIILSLQGTKKSEGTVASRENLDYTMSIIERQVRGSKQVSCVGSSQINYLDQDGKISLFGCFVSGLDSFVASGSATTQSRLTGDAVKIVVCTFTCEDADNDPTTPPKYVDIFFQAQPVNLIGTQSSTVTTQNRIYLRNY